MKRPFYLVMLLLACLTARAQELKYVVKNNDWDIDSLGTHRVVMTVDSTNAIGAWVNIDWRRNDSNPENKAIFVVDSAADQRVMNVTLTAINRETCQLYFQPAAGHHKYFAYYLPYHVDRKSNYPNAKYLSLTDTASTDWLKSVKFLKNITPARVECIEEINALNSFYPMDVIATSEEVSMLIHNNAGRSYLVFPEDRMHPIQMKHDLPQPWIENGMWGVFNGEARRGENYTYQLGIYR